MSVQLGSLVGLISIVTTTLALEFGLTLTVDGAWTRTASVAASSALRKLGVMLKCLAVPEKFSTVSVRCSVNCWLASTAKTAPMRVMGASCPGYTARLVKTFASAPFINMALICSAERAGWAYTISAAALATAVGERPSRR